MSKVFSSSFLAASALGFAVAGLSACSGGTSSPQPIQTAPASPLTAHLKQCYTANLSGSSRTVIREKVPVCRRDASNQTVEHEHTPRFQVGRTKNSKIGFRQVIAVKFSDKSSEPKADPTPPSSEKSPERLAVETTALEFLTKTCAPLINSIFQRSGFESSHRFQIYRDGDQVALSSEIAKNGTVGDGFEFGDTKPGRPTPAPGVGAAVVARPQEDETSKRAYHLLLEMQLTKEKGLRLADEIADVESGSLAGYTPPSVIAASSTQVDPLDGVQVARLQFCGQLAMRIAENYGLSEGRDCKSMTQPADVVGKESSEKSTKPQTGKHANTGLMKPGKVVSDLGKVKLAKREIHDILSPVCGPLKDQKGL